MRILFVEPFESTLFSFRKELLDSLIEHGHDIFLCIKKTERISNEYKTKVKEIVNVDLDLKSKNIFKNLRLKKVYKKIINRVKPDLILSYTIKPNIYCASYAKNIPMIANITGLGNMFKSKGLLSFLGIHLYKKTFKNVDYVFFQNEASYLFFKNNKIPINNYKIIPGSGVNLDKFIPSPINKDNTNVNFLFASRAIKEKGFDLLVEAIPKVIEVCHNIHFNFLTAEEEILNNSAAKSLFMNYKDYLTILGRTNEMEKIYRNNDFTILPSYYKEGISNVLLESLASGRPVITTKDNPGCMETLIEGVNGFGVASKDLQSLTDSIINASKLSKKEIETMGLAGRQHVVRFFDRKNVITNYLDVISKIMD